MIVLIINGNTFSTLSEFYDEVERRLTKGLDFKIGRNLDAFNDVLRGGFGVYEYEQPFTFIWKNSEKSKHALGFEETVKHYTLVLKNCDPTNIEFFEKKLEDACNNKGETLFNEILEIIRGHPHITLILE